MFSAEHFAWMGICAVFVTVLTVLSVRKRFSFRLASGIMAGIALVSEISKMMSDMEPVDGADPTQGMVLKAGSLPLHLCSLLIFAFFYLPFCKSERHKRFLTSLIVPVGLVGSLLAIIIATNGTDFADIGAYQCFVYHAAMIWYALYLTATGQADLGLRAWLTNLLTLLALAFGMVWVNSALQAYDTNFLYVVRPPAEGLPLINLDNGWYAYFFTVLLCGFICITAVHLPFVIRDIRHMQKKRRANRTHT